MSRSLTFPSRHLVSFESEATASFGLERCGAAAGKRLRTFLIVALVAAMPVNVVFLASNKENVNIATADAFIPLGVLFLIWLFLQGRLRLPMISVCLLVVGTTATSILWNMNVSFLNQGNVGMAIEIIKVLQLWLYFYLFINLVQTRSDLRLAVKVWALGSMVEALCGIGGSLAYQLAGIETPFAEMFRAQGTLGDANLFAGHLAAGFLLTLLYRTLARPAPAWTGVALVLQLAGIYFSASRGGLLSFGISLLIVWLFALSVRQKLAIVFALGVVILLLSATPQGRMMLDSSPITARLKTSTVSLGNPEAQQRARLWRVALRGFMDSPIIGVGRGNFAYLDAADSVDGGDDAQGGGKAHNTYLEILCETGLMGFCAYMALVVAVLSKLIRGWFANPNSVSRAASIILFTAVVTLGLSGVTISIENYRGLWILLALAVEYHKLYQTPVLLKLTKALAVPGARPSF